MKETFLNLKERITTSPELECSLFYRKFILEITALVTAVGAMYAQKEEDGKIHLIQLISGTIKLVENNYSACEKERDFLLYSR